MKSGSRTGWTARGRRLAAYGLAVIAVAASPERAASSAVPFSEQHVIWTVTRSTSLFVADLDGDGDLDVLAGDLFELGWFENLGPDDGTGPCAPTVTSACFGDQQLITTDVPQSVFSADLDGDGDLDVLAATVSLAGDKIDWYENLGPDDGTGPCAPLVTSACFGGQQVISTAADGALSVFAADVDGDGDLDALSASQSDDKVAWYENLGPDSGTGPCAPTVTAACFGAQQVISIAADNPFSVFSADLDGDGDLDALSASVTDDKIAWYENLGADDGTGPCAPTVTSACFGAQQVLSAMTDGAGSVSSADVDGDGDLDVLALSFHDDKIVWFENLGADNGTGPCAPTVTSACFTAEQVVSSATDGPAWVASADVNGDGVLDVVSASYRDDKIAWFENLGADDGTGPCAPEVTSACFGVEQVISTLAEEAVGAFPADLDGDGDLDVVSASSLDGKIAWYENRTIHRSADFSAAASIVNASANGVDQLFAGDVDQDGDPDLLSADSASGVITFYSNGGDGSSWNDKALFGSATGASSVHGADLDRDGDLDALSASAGDGSIRWYENTAGNGSSWSDTTITSSASAANDVHAADLDNDGDLDALSASTGDDRIAWYENRLDEATADFGPQQTLTTAADGARSVFAADLDADGDMDVLSASQADDKIAWYENTGGGVFQVQQLVISLAVDSPQAVSAADMDGDGDQDVLSAGTDKVAWHENVGDGVFAQTHVVGSLVEGANEVSAADLDGDGDMDILTVIPADNTLVWYENETTFWTSHVVSTSATDARQAIAADIDRDGKLDIVSASSGNNTVAWQRNLGGQFSTAATDTAQKFLSDSQLEDLLAVEVTHNGRPGDSDLELVSLEVRLTDSVAVPLASAQATALFETVRVYADDGSGVFEETKDALISTVGSFDLGVDGRQTLPMTDDDPNARVSFGSPATFFITFEMTANAESQIVSAFQVAHQSGADEADDADHDIPLAFVEGSEVGTGVIDTALSTATCTAPFDLSLENRTVTATLVCEAGTVLRTGPSVVVAIGGDLTLKAGQAIEMKDGLESNGALRVEINP